MVLAMCLSLLPASTLAATLSNGNKVTELGTGSYSITLKNDCEAAVKYSVTLNGTTTEVTLNGDENLTLKGNANETYSVTWLGGASEDYSYTEPETKEKSGRFWQAANLYDGFDGADGKTYSNTQASNATLTCNHNGLTYSPDFYYLTGVEGSVITFYSEGRKWNGYFYVRESDGESYSGGFTGGRAEARNEALEANGIDPNSEGRYHNYEKDDNNVAMWVYWKATPYISFTSTAEQTQDIAGDFTVAALNVDGMPEQVSITVFNGEVSSISLNQDGPQEAGSEKIGQYIANSDIDILGLSENFNFYKAIQDNATGYATGTQRLQEGLPTSIGVWNALQIEFPFDTDGLNLMYKTSKGITVSGETMTAWNDHYSPTKFYGLGSIGIDVPQENGADGMIDKGYRFYQVKVDTGVVVDVYILHMDAYDDPLDNDARSKQLRQLAAAINQNTNGNPIIVMGDTNCRYTRDTLKTDLVEACDLTDAWIKLERNNIYPNMGDEALMVTNPDLGYQKGEVVDKVFYKNAEGSNLTIEAVDYDVDADGYVYEGTTNMLGDHPPVIVKFKYTLQSNNQEHEHKWSSEWSSDEGHHWHECLNDDCPFLNSEKDGYAAHTFNETVDKQPTCTEPGSQTLTCSECGYTKTESIPATGHTWGEGEVTKPATSTEKGEMTYTCTVCGAKDTVTIPKLDVEYTFTLTFDKESYNVGATATATISLSKTEGTGSVGAIGFALDVPDGLTLNQITPLVAGTFDTNNGKYAINVNSDEGLTVGQTGVPIAEVTFTVNGSFTGETANVTLGLNHHEVTLISQMIPRGSEVVTDSATLVKSYTVKLAAGEHTSFAGAPTTITVTAGTTFGQLTLPEVTTDQYYEFDGWYNGETKMTDEMIVTGGMTLTAKATPKTYTFTEPTADNATIEDLTGVTGGKATYGTAITFTVNPADSYAVTGVTYTVDSTSTTLTAAADGTYTIPGSAITGDVTVNVTTVHYHTITFAAEEGATLSGTTTLYVEDGQAGFYTDTTCTTSASVPTPAPQTGYRLAKDTEAEPLWSGSNGTNYTTNALSSATFTEDVTLTAQAVKTWKITFQAGSHVTMTATEVTVDDGTLFGDVQEPSYAVDDHYTFVGWYNGNDKMEATDTIGSDLTLTATAVASSFKFSEVSDNADVTVTSGVTDNQEATYGTAITFTVNPADSYAVTGVSYAVGDSAAIPLTADNGTYTIDGSAITDDITVYVTATQYHKITFQAGEGTTMNTVTAYVMHGQSALYTGTDFKTPFTVPSPEAEDGYRLAADTAAESLWSDGTNKYQSSALGSSVTFTDDATLTAQAVKQWTVTFRPGTNGSFAQDAVTELTVDTGTQLTQAQIPSVTANTGYTFTGWDNNVSEAITADTVFTAQYTDATYTLTLPTIDGVTFTVSGATGSGNAYTVTHGTNVTIDVTVDETKADVNSISYTIGNGEPVTETNFSSGITILGSDITGNINLTVDSIPVYAITVNVSGNGTVNGERTSTKYFNEGTSADTVKAAFEIVANTGYEYVAPTFEDVDDNATYTVTFTLKTYTVTLPGGTTGTATHGLPFTIPLSLTEGQLLLGDVTYQVGEGGAVTLEPDENGNYTIPGSAITGPITVKYTTVNATWVFIAEDVYMAAPDDKQVAILDTDKLKSGTYALDVYGDMFWSEKYDAYVCFVNNNETAATLTPKLAVSQNTVTEIDYSGDINGVGGVTPADSAPINAVLHDVTVEYEISDLMRFQFDVTGDKKVTAQDIIWILNEYTGASNED